MTGTRTIDWENQTRVTKHKSMCTREHKEQFEAPMQRAVRANNCLLAVSRQSAYTEVGNPLPVFFFLFINLHPLLTTTEVVGLKIDRSSKSYFQSRLNWIAPPPCNVFWRAFTVCLDEEVHTPSPALPSRSPTSAPIEADGLARGRPRVFFSTQSCILLTDDFLSESLRTLPGTRQSISWQGTAFK